MAIVDRCGFDPVLCADTFAEGFDFYHARRDVRTPELAYYLALQSRPRAALARAADEPAAGHFRRLRRRHARADARNWRRRLQREMPGKLHTHVLHPPRYRGFFTEISPAGVTKWSAIQRLAQDWGIDDAEICAVGDDVNDIPMIRAAGLGVAMGNAQPAVKAAADRIAPTPRRRWVGAGGRVAVGEEGVGIRDDGRVRAAALDISTHYPLPTTSPPLPTSHSRSGRSSTTPPASLAASNMPCDSSPRSMASCRLLTTTIWRPTSCSGV